MTLPHRFPLDLNTSHLQTLAHKGFTTIRSTFFKKFPIQTHILISALSMIMFVAPAAKAIETEKFTLTSMNIVSHKPIEIKQVFNGFGCKGNNLSPELSWSKPPFGTKSLAITMYDPDAPTGSGWWHWVAFNIPTDTPRLVEGASGTSMPEGTIESITDFGSKGYGGPCPPEGNGTHRYIITLWALDVDKLDLDAQASGAKVGFFLNQHKMAKATLTGNYKR